jgi:hypothetical protein
MVTFQESNPMVSKAAPTTGATSSSSSTSARNVVFVRAIFKIDPKLAFVPDWM